MSGPIEKVVTMTTNDPAHATVRLSIKATVEPEIAMSESVLYFENVPARKEARKEVLLTIPAEKPIRILSATSTDSRVAARLEPVPGGNGKKVRLIVIRKPNVKPGYHFGHIIVKTDSRLAPEFTIYESGTATEAQ